MEAVLLAEAYQAAARGMSPDGTRFGIKACIVGYSNERAAPMINIMARMHFALNQPLKLAIANIPAARPSMT
jgi:hypothetical protein